MNNTSFLALEIMHSKMHTWVNAHCVNVNAHANIGFMFFFSCLSQTIYTVGLMQTTWEIDAKYWFLEISLWSKKNYSKGLRTFLLFVESCLNQPHHNNKLWFFGECELKQYLNWNTIKSSGCCELKSSQQVVL